MIQKTITLLFLLLFLSSFNGVFAQNISDVDVNSLSQSEIEKVKQTIKEKGLTNQEAIELARQRGASEQQIQDMQKRLNEENPNDSIFTVVDPFEEAEMVIEKKENEDSIRHEKFLPPRMKIFGAELFNNENLTFEPSANVLTPSNYELNIGDQVLINIWGNSQSNYQLTVNRNGQIFIPDVGPVYVAGLTFSRAAEKIKNRLTAIYADMAGDSPHTFAQVNLGQLNSIRVNLVGEVGTPGTYTLPATATAFNALYLSGGPNEIGSFRNISIIRNNKTVKVVDIYNFLVNGDPSDNVNLKDNDVIFIPPAEKQVQVKGYFKRDNYIFEMKQGESLDDLIRFAGGYTKDAYTARVQVYRKTQKRQQIIDVTEDMLSSTALMDGDEVRNTDVLDIFENRVTITGAVFRPGEYEWKEGMMLNDLINKANGVKEDVFKNKGLITRQNPDLTIKTIAFDVDKVINGEINIKLIPEDIVSVKSHLDIGTEPYVTISGEVLRDGEIPWSEGLTVSDVLFMAGGFTEAADSAMIEISRRLTYQEAASLTDTLVHIFTINQSRKLKGGNSFVLEPFDQISVKRAPGFREQASVIVTGEVVYAGNYALRQKTQRISDLVKFAKGITPQAFLEGATLTRRTDELGKEDIAIDLQKILQNPRQGNDLFLKDGDSLHIPEFAQTVKVSGTVQNPFSLTYENGKTAKYYINRSGGYGDNANKRKTYVKYANGYTVSTKGFLGFKKYPKVMPGSVVVVPEKPKKENKNTGIWLTIASTMASIGVSIATIASLSN